MLIDIYNPKKRPAPLLTYRSYICCLESVVGDVARFSLPRTVCSLSLRSSLCVQMRRAITDNGPNYLRFHEPADPYSSQHALPQVGSQLGSQQLLRPDCSPVHHNVSQQANHLPFPTYQWRRVNRR
jgi:hypothetical protein